MYPQWRPGPFHPRPGVGPNVFGPQQGPPRPQNFAMPPHPGGGNTPPFHYPNRGPFQQNMFPNVGYPGPPVMPDGRSDFFNVPQLPQFRGGPQPPPYFAPPLPPSNRVDQRLPSSGGVELQTHSTVTLAPRNSKQANYSPKRSGSVGVKSSDEAIVERFLFSIGKLHAQSKLENKSARSDVATKFLKIHDARQLHVKVNSLIRSLEESSKDLEPNRQKINDLKMEIMRILSILNDPEVLSDLKRKVARRKKRRQRLKRLRKKLFETRQEEERTIEEKHKEIEQWQAQEKIKLERQMREAEMQKQIDEALVEIRRERATVAKSLEMVNLLAKLRKARFNARQNKSQNVPDAIVNERFDTTVQKARSTLSTYKATCDEKAASLTMFIETEQRAAKLAIEKKRNKAEQEKKSRWEQERKHVLFGSTDSGERNAFDALWPVQQLHKQADENLHSLLQYRLMWDRYLSSSGTRIPTNWVEPVEPSSEKWEKYFVGQTATAKETAVAKNTKS